MARYRDREFQVFPRKMAKGWVWYYYTYKEDGSRSTNRSTGIGYSNKKDAVRTKREAEAFCEELLDLKKLDEKPEPTLQQWYDEKQFWDWNKSKYVRRKLARSERGKPQITESYWNSPDSVDTLRG